MSQTSFQSSSKSRSPERSTTVTASKSVVESPPIPAEPIARRAYEKFLARGCQHGFDQEDWLAAEQELIAEARET